MHPRGSSLIVILLLFSVSATLAGTIIVDKNGSGQFRSIQPAIDAASTGDTVKVWPGTYSDQGVTLNKNITLMGSGYENTIITGDFDPSVTIIEFRINNGTSGLL